MCTIIAAVHVWPEAPLVIAANRDEHLDRPSSPPQLLAAGEVSPRAVLAPRDLVAGGTWLGLNDTGLFVGITNRRVTGIDPARRSRGELPFAALASANHIEARTAMLELDAAQYNPFHLLLADRSGASIVWSDGARLHALELGPGIHVLTERSFDAGFSARHDTLAELADTLRRGPLPAEDRWHSILADHRPHGPPGPDRVGLDAMCVHADPLNYGTRSSTLIELLREPGNVRFLHAPGRPCRTAFTDHHADTARLFAAAELE